MSDCDVSQMEELMAREEPADYVFDKAQQLIAARTKGPWEATTQDVLGQDGLTRIGVMFADDDARFAALIGSCADEVWELVQAVKDMGPNWFAGDKVAALRTRLEEHLGRGP